MAVRRSRTAGFGKYILTTAVRLRRTAGVRIYFIPKLNQFWRSQNGSDTCIVTRIPDFFLPAPATRLIDLLSMARHKENSIHAINSVRRAKGRVALVLVSDGHQHNKIVSIYLRMIRKLLAGIRKYSKSSYRKYIFGVVSTVVSTPKA